ncbi:MULTISPECIES: sigma-S stabilization anti-adapter protein IraP [unclassified Brenneria]|uniref:sigma-S stabilization anti-adapter protein IraP n=1 Tax=unclassified Brenneria TaxID=2634434 RepID=UPI00155710F0|nr:MULTISPECIES: sigma-S stabilization anti-adapter protein IraP [unclassified Brenneria]MBJ7220375.1 anti-adapter protein [Brenneria sp. L3-3C-1]MEE3641619.1 sigma-S stabilization anti-adapter protein IraP [Brenneria sp. L3_3C_1]MEE3649750.1 sigma-S stabilization anti-adapter protein IraP [Brenneria sp. HEZEL_4_2_4]NPC99708.1 anti-adapter protein [Brenneria sp. hezel4-2-4]
MNSLLYQLLIRLAEKEVGEKELHAKIESLEMLVVAIVSMLDDEKINELTKKVQGVLAEATQSKGEDFCLAAELLTRNINRITSISIRD